MKIKLNDKTGADLDKLIPGKLLLQAGSGGGKSFTIRRVLEQSFGHIPHIIIDTEGEFSSLREKYDYILIGKGYDIAADPKTAAMMALRLWERRVSAIIDIYELDPLDRQKFVENFVGAMINAPKNLWKPVMLVIDEAHEYAPENEKSQYGLALHRLASKGRKRQILAVFATQSIASLSKRIVASCKNKLIGYASETNDVKRAAFELGFTPQEALRLRDLDPGEFYAFGPAISKEVIKLKIGPVHTKHEETRGRISKVAPPSAKIKRELAALADLPQAVAEQAKTVDELKAQIRKLEAASRMIVKVEAPPVVMSVSQWREYGKRYKYWEFFEDETRKEFRKFKNDLYKKLLDSHGTFNKVFEKAIAELREEATKGVVSRLFKGEKSRTIIIEEASNVPDKVFEQLSAQRRILPPIDGEKPLSKGAIAVLSYLWKTGCPKTKAQCWIAAGYAPGGGFNNIIYELTGKGFIVSDGGKYRAVSGTEFVDPLFDRDVQKWDSKLSKGAKAVFRFLKEGGISYTKEELASMTGYALGGGFNNIIYELTGKELAVKDGTSYKMNPVINDL